MLQISESVIVLGLRPLWKTPSLIFRILHILLCLIQSELLNIECIGRHLGLHEMWRSGAREKLRPALSRSSQLSTFYELPIK